MRMKFGSSFFMYLIFDLENGLQNSTEKPS